MKNFNYIFLLFILCYSLPVYSYDFVSNNCYYNLDTANRTATITYGGGYSGIIEIPEQIVGPKDIVYTVTAIGDDAFTGSRISSVKIPNTIEKIGNNAFRSCNSLTSITIPNRVQSIGAYCFSDCTNLASAYLSNSLTSIEQYTFYNCTSLTSIIIPNLIGTIFDSAFEKCSKLASVSFPNAILNISNKAFKDCTSLLNIAFPESIQIIGDYAFQNCNSLNSIILSKNQKEIGAYAFNKCKALSTVTIPKTVAKIGENAFYETGILTLIYEEGCTTALRTYANSASSVMLPSTLTSIENSAFYDYRSLVSIMLPNGIKKIGQTAFYNCTKLSSLVIPASVECINNNAFGNSGLTTLEYAQGCSTALRTYATGLTTVIIPNSVKSFDDNVFEGCAKLENVYISDLEMWNYIFANMNSSPFPSPYKIFVNGHLLTVLNADFGCDISNYAFYQCKELRIVNLTGNITGVQDYAFAKCIDLDAVAMGANVKEIGICVFQECENLTSIRLGSGVEKIGNNAFAGCTNMNSIFMGGKETSIGDSAFRGCSKLQNVHLSNTLLCIGNSAFRDCYKLETINIPSSVTEIADYAFYDCRNLLQIDFPDSLANIGKYSFYNCDRLQQVTISDYVTTISNYCFSDCDSIRYVYLGSGIKTIGEYAFANVKRLIGFYCYAVNVPKCNSNAFNGSDPAYISLYAPDESISSYASISPWNNFGVKKGLTSAPVFVNKIEVTPSTVVLSEGDFTKIVAKAIPENATDTKINWSSSNSAVAYINNTGSVLANEEGIATVTAESADKNGARTNCLVIVSNNFIPVSKISLSADSLKLVEGKEMTLAMVTYPEDATYPPITWKSSNSSVASVNSVGVITALSEGEAKIICSADDGKGAFAECCVTVSKPVDPTIGDANVDGRVSVADAMLAVKIVLENLSNDTDISLFDTNQDGVITISDISGIIDLILNKNANQIKMIDIHKDIINLNIDETCTISHTVIPSRNALDIEWNSSDPSIATVSETGLVTGISKGTVIITAKSLVNKNIIDSCVVVVYDLSDFKKIEYIYNNGSAPCIDLGTTFKDNTRIQMKYEYLISNGTALIGDTDGTDDYTDLRCFAYNSNIYFDVPGRDTSEGARIQCDINMNQIYEHEFGNFYIKNISSGKIIVNGSEKSISRSKNLQLWPGAHMGSRPTAEQAKIYYIKIFEGDTIVKNFVPVLYNDEYGLLDLISGEFYGTINGNKILGSKS